MQVVLDDDSICNAVKIVLKKWQDDFCSLLNVDSVINVERDSTFNSENVNLDKDISILEIVKADEEA